jgi:predicted amidohydrolase
MNESQSLKAATVQFQHQANNKKYNLLIMEKFIEQAALEQVKILTFPEMYHRVLARTQTHRN